MNGLVSYHLKKSTMRLVTSRSCNVIKRSYIDPTVASIVIIGGSIACVNMINIPNPKMDVATARLVAFCALKGALYGIVPEISIPGMILTYYRFDHHLIPASVWCKHLRQCTTKSEEKEKFE
jgi:hypothetical protein